MDLWPMVLAITLPNIVYIYEFCATNQVSSLLVCACSWNSLATASASRHIYSTFLL